jgi:hypothetical protein
MRTNKIKPVIEAIDSNESTVERLSDEAADLARGGLLPAVHRSDMNFALGDGSVRPMKLTKIPDGTSNTLI